MEEGADRHQRLRRHAGGCADSGRDAAVHCAAQAAAAGGCLLKEGCRGRPHKRAGIGGLPQHVHRELHAPWYFRRPGQPLPTSSPNLSKNGSLHSYLSITMLAGSLHERCPFVPVR